jgi:hypothetical protein
MTELLAELRAPARRSLRAPLAADRRDIDGRIAVLERKLTATVSPRWDGTKMRSTDRCECETATKDRGE